MTRRGFIGAVTALVAAPLGIKRLCGTTTGRFASSEHGGFIVPSRLAQQLCKAYAVPPRLMQKCCSITYINYEEQRQRFIHDMLKPTAKAVQSMRRLGINHGARQTN